MEFLDTLSTSLHLDSLDPRHLVGACGVLLLVLGSRIYRLAVVLPGVLGGVWVASQATAGAGDQARHLAMFLLGLGGGVLAHLLERFAVSLAGALILGGLADAFAPLVLHTETPWYLPAVAALVGMVAAPFLYERFLPLLTSVLGALALAWSVGRSQDLVFIGLVAAGGLALQLLIRRRPGKEKKA